jgi:DNA-binding response OmpR family regulator
MKHRQKSSRNPLRPERNGRRQAPLGLDAATLTATAGGRPVARLTATMARLLATLLAARGRVVGRPALLEAAWGPGYAAMAGSTRRVDAAVSRLRRRLGGSSGPYSESGEGYRI